MFLGKNWKGLSVDLLQILCITCLLLLWNLFVIHYPTKWVYNFVKRYRDIPAAYIGRKIVHIFCGGVTAVFIPLFYEGYYELVIASAFGLAFYLLFRRRYKPMYWFQIKENMYEVHFAFAYGTILLFSVLLQNLLVGLIPLYFMSFGDSATGLIRAVTQKRQVKSWEGSLAMLTICIIIGYILIGAYGLLIGIAATFVEKIPGIDDNITIPMLTGTLVYINFLFV
jgi:phytol kinase